MRKFPLTQILKKKAQSNPYSVSLLARCLLISSGFNDYLVLLAGVSFEIYMFTGVIYHVVTTALFIIIGWKISMLKDVLSVEKWS